MAIHQKGTTAAVLAHLAENGPAIPSDLTDFASDLVGDSNDRRSGYQVLVRLRRAGLIVTKEILTPEGLAALRATGWTPRIYRE